MVRPPPLQLHYDGFASQTRSWKNRIYYTDWRGIVIAVALLNTLRFLLSASSYYQDAVVDNSQHLPQLSRFSLALGVMYTASLAIEIFGISSAYLQRIAMIRIYAHLAIVSALLISVAGVIVTFTYFRFADDLVDECTRLAMNGKAAMKSTFRGDLWPTDISLTMVDAKSKCLFAWSDDSISQIISTFLFYLLPATLYSILAYTYYRQTTDPSHPANLCTHSVTRGSAIRMQAIPGDTNATQYPYSPLYNNVSGPSSMNSPFALSPRHARRKSTSKAQVKDLTLNLALDPALAAPAPFSATVAPGPPSYSIGNSTYPFSIGDLSSGVEDDRFI